MKKMKKGFTLAEVLITLGIIGVVASIVMPSVMTNYTYKTIGVKLAKFVSQVEGSTRPFVVQNEIFKYDTTSNNVETYIEESFLLKNAKDYEGEDKSLVLTSAPTTDKYANFTDSTSNILKIKDGTSMVVYPVANYTNDEIDPYKVGKVVFGITFDPNVKGLPGPAQKVFDFVVTDLGYVYPNRTSDTCVGGIADADYQTNASFFKEGKACAQSSTGAQG